MLAEQKMQAEWKPGWDRTLACLCNPRAGAGKTKRVTQQGTADTRNDIMLCAVVSAESHDAAANAFEGQPHLQIPQSSDRSHGDHSTVWNVVVGAPRKRMRNVAR